MMDARVMNRMDDETRMGHMWLTRWSQAIKRDNPQPWPSISVLGRVIEQGGHFGSTGTKPPTELAEDVAAVDKLVASMRGDCRVSVLAYYRRWETPQVVADDLGWSMMRLSSSLRRAREAVAIGMRTAGFGKSQS